MIYLLLLSLILLLFIHFFIFKIDWLSPTIMFILTYIISLSFLVLNSKSWQISLTSKTFFILIIGIIALSLGEVSAKMLYGSRKKYILGKNYINEKIYLTNPSPIGTNIIIIYMLLIMIWYFMSIIDTVSISGMNDMTLIGAYRSSEKSLNPILTLSLRINLAITYYYLLVFIKNYIYLGIARKKYLIPVLIHFITTALSSGRMEILYTLTTIVSISYIMYNKRTGWKLKFNLKIIKKMLLSGTLALAIFYLLGYLTGKSNVHSFYYIISWYIGSPIAALDNFLIDYKYSFDNFGNETLIGINNLFGMLGIHLNIANERFLELVLLGNMPSRTNIYTSFRRVINDYGYYGMILYQFLVGFIFTIIYQKIKLNKWKNMDFGILLYVYIFRYLAFQFTDERILVNVFSLTTIVQITTFWILLRYFTKYKKVPVEEGGI